MVNHSILNGMFIVIFCVDKFLTLIYNLKISSFGALQLLWEAVLPGHTSFSINDKI